MIKSVITAVAIVLGVHALTYALVQLLPNAATIALGVLGGNVDAVSEFWNLRPVAPYPQHLINALQGDLGLTISQVPVAFEIQRALWQSSVPLALSLLLAVIGVFVVPPAASPTRSNPLRPLALVDFASFLPPFIFPFLGAALAFATPFAGNINLLRSILVGSIAIPTFLVFASNYWRVERQEHRQNYVSVLRANGMRTSDVASLASMAALYRFMAVIDRAAVVAIASMMLAEPILGLPGLGGLAVRAIRTADPNLTLGVTVTLAIVVVTIGVLASWAREAFAVWVGRSP